jgi:hypothetical protein
MLAETPSWNSTAGDNSHHTFFTVIRQDFDGTYPKFWHRLYYPVKHFSGQAELPPYSDILAM